MENLTQIELAKMLNVDRSTVAKWETGGALPTADKLPKIAKALNCKIDDLF
jgi:putative HTH-type transcriptional regulator